MSVATQPTFAYGTTSVNRLGLLVSDWNSTGRRIVKALEVNGQAARTTPRFWKSFFKRFQISDNIFRYFEPEEVFDRIYQRAKGVKFQYCIETTPGGAKRLLGVSDPSTRIMDYDALRNLMLRHGGQSLQYSDGTITSLHVPRSGEHDVLIGPDKFQNRFALECPIDGYQKPRVYLSLMRQICANGAIGMAPAFRSELNLGKKDGVYNLERVMQSYDNGEGYAALRQRFESAQNSWASIHEYRQLDGTLDRLAINKEELEKHRRSLSALAGTINSIYGIANVDALSQKRQRILPTKARVYDFINFASELATHHTKTGDGRRLQGYIGTLISDEYDMEGTANQATEFSDFFATKPFTNN